MSKNYEMQRAMILNCVSLGMEPYRAYILSELPKEEIEKLEADEQFLREVEITQVILEKNLLVKHKDALETALEKGNSKPIEWMLSKVNPDKWADKKDKLIIPGKLVISKDDESLL